MQNAIRPSAMMSSVSTLRKFWATAVAPTVTPRKIVIMFISSFVAVFTRRSQTPDSFIRLPSISIPTREAESGTMRETITVTAIGNTIFSSLET